MRELEFPQAFGLVPWGHHIDIIEHCQSIDEALFYIKKTIEGGWSRNGYHKGHLRFRLHIAGRGLFFHIPLNCYVVVELKAVPFQPEFAGKLNFYVNAVDDLIKTPSQNPTIGLLICSNKDETEVQYAFNGITTPMGVASYDNVQVKRLQEQLPSVEELKARIRLLEEELQRKE